MRQKVRTLVPPPQLEASETCRTLVPPSLQGPFQTTRCERLDIEKPRAEAAFRPSGWPGRINFGLRYPLGPENEQPNDSDFGTPASFGASVPPTKRGSAMVSDFGTPSRLNPACGDSDAASSSCRRWISDIGTPAGAPSVAGTPCSHRPSLPKRACSATRTLVPPPSAEASAIEPRQAGSGHFRSPSSIGKWRDHPRQESYPQEALGLWNPSPNDRRVAHNPFSDSGTPILGRWYP